MDFRERFIDALKGSPLDRMPAACPVVTTTLDQMRLSDSYWPEAHTDAEMMARLSLAGSTYAGMESARLPFDIVMDAEALGAKIDLADRSTAPFVNGPLIHSLDDIRKIGIPEVRDAGRVPVIDEVVGIIKRTRPDLPVVVSIVAPFTLSTQLLGVEKAMADIASTPERYIDFVVFVARWSSFLASHFAEVGADAIMMVDDEANDSILGAEMFESFAHPAQRKVADAIRSAGALSILHICGDVRSTTDAMVRSGVDAISIGSEMSMTGTRGIVKDRCRIIGNIDPVKVLLNGTPKKVEAEVKRCIKEGVDIVAPSCGLSPKTPLANLQAMTDAIRKHGHIKGLETPRKRQGVGQDPIPERIRNR